MATTDAQTLTTYTVQALKRLEETTDPSALSHLTKELYVLAREYPTYRQLFNRDDVRQAVGEALTEKNAERLKAILTGVFTEVAKEGRPEHIREVPGPDPFATEESYASVIKLEPKDRVAQLSEVEETSWAHVAEKKAAQRRQFAKQLTENFISRSKIQITNEQKIQEEKRIETALSLEWYRSQAEINRMIEQSPYRETVSDRDLRRVAGDSEKAARTVSATQERMEQVLMAAATSIANTDELVVHKPKVFLEIAADQAERSNAPVAQILSHAAALERATEGFTGTPSVGLPQNLSFLAETPLQKVVAWAVDKLPEGPRNAIVAGVVGGSWEKVIDTATHYYGQRVVNENWFQQAITRGNQGLPDKKSALQSLTGGVQKVLGDVAGTVFRKPMDQSTIAYLETIRLHITVTETVNYQQFYTAAAYRQNPGLLSMGLNIGFQYGTRKAAQALIKAGTEKAIAGTAAKGALELLAGAGTGGWGLLLAAGGSLLQKGVGFFKNLIGVGGGKVSSDKWLLIAAAIFALVFFLPILPLFNLPAFNQSMIDTSLADNLGVGAGGGGGPSINCQLTPNDPQCKFTPCVGDCRWPASGYITQGPRTAQFCSAEAHPTHGSGSASSQNAIDIAGFGGGPIYATRVGTVERIFSGCPDSGASINPLCGGGPDPSHPGDGPHPEYAGYGNHVILSADNGYRIIFGHLKSAINVRYGEKITNPNTQIGWMDNSGHSFGTHLHFGVLSGGNILDLIPTNDPTVGPAAIDGCIQQTPGCTKVCPTTPVRVGS